jgi:ATP-dependent DNA helicase RecG
LLQEEQKYFIEIMVSPYSVPISLRGRYYYRSGSVKQELTGASLNEFLLKRSGHTWDDIIETRAQFNDIDEETVRVFLRMAEQAGRLSESQGLTLPELFEKLRLTEKGLLKRAAIILLGKDPGKFYNGLSVKIGRFGIDDADIRFQEVEEGNIFQVLEAVLQQLNHKFLIRAISFEGMNRIEKCEYPIPALREMLLNALIHRNYMGVHTQIRVYDDKLFVWNDGGLPEGITLNELKHSHPSRPRNPLIADVCFKGGFIDLWGSGTVRIINACKEYNLPSAEFGEQNGGFIVTLFKGKGVNEGVNEGVNGLYTLIEQNPGQRTPFFIEKMKAPGKTIERWIKQLKNEKKIEFRGASKSGGYYKMDTL